MTLIELQRALRQLRCSGMAAGLEGRLLQAQAEKLAPIDFLSTLVQDELLKRQDRLLGDVCRPPWTTASRSDTERSGMTSPSQGSSPAATAAVRSSGKSRRVGTSTTTAQAIVGSALNVTRERRFWRTVSQTSSEGWRSMTRWSGG